MDNSKIANKLKDKALKALHNANIDVENKRTRILNANYALGEFFALSELIWEYDINVYVQLGEQTKEYRDKLLEITEDIYSI